MMNRLFTASCITSRRLFDPHFSDEVFFIQRYMAKKTYLRIHDTECQTSEFLSLLSDKNADISPEPHFYDDSEHFLVTLNCHQDDLSLTNSNLVDSNLLLKAV